MRRAKPNTTPRTGDYVFITAGPHHARVGRMVRYDWTVRGRPQPVVALLRSGSLPAEEVTTALTDLLTLWHTWVRGTARALPDEQTMLDLYEKGMTAEDIAAMYGVQRYSVYKARQRMGLPGGLEQVDRGTYIGDSYRAKVVPALAPRRGDTMNVGCFLLVTDGDFAERPGQLVGWDLIGGRLWPVLDLLAVHDMAEQRVTVHETQVRVLLRPFPGAKVSEPTQDTLRLLLNAGITPEEIAKRYRMPLPRVRFRIRRLHGVAAPAWPPRHEFPFGVKVSPEHKHGSAYKYLSALAGVHRGTAKVSQQTRVAFRWSKQFTPKGYALTYSPKKGIGVQPAQPTDTVKRYIVPGVGRAEVRFAA
jgi:uncharacterized protein (DUF433 family)